MLQKRERGSLPLMRKCNCACTSVEVQTKGRARENPQADWSASPRSDAQRISQFLPD